MYARVAQPGEEKNTAFTGLVAGFSGQRNRIIPRLKHAPLKTP
ncbi:hypothetical protein BN137_1642 [Cronobacter condimenti 1330]|uniref:Uncharacterized protein n=1 Tax=Cronobacter condimenti 1330 TaxID=1073999 RepID=K8ADD2_9ENTR|nr:hypothetical protein BN137_1642 [Cronobacter condimenti 1330]